MPTQLSESEKRERLKELISDFSVAMLATHTQGGEIRARPLAIAEQRDDGALYFATAVDTPKVAEMESDHHVNITMQDGRRFVSITGSARIVADRALVGRLWSESWKVWFPKGKDDPSLRIVVVEPSEASYWDTAGVAGLKYVFEMARAYLSGKRPPSDGDEAHTARVKM